MLVIQTLLAVRRLPPLMLIGLLVMAIGGVLDVVIHLQPADHGAHAGFGTEHLAHIVGIAGMSLVLAGLVLHGARRHRRPLADRHGGFDSNAHR
jgi:hypothetical protein